MRPRGDTRLAMVAAVLLAVGGVLSAGELLAMGLITPPVLALDVIGVTMIPFALLAMVVRAPEPARPPGEPAPGRVQFDWQRFEADFRAYARQARAQGASGADDL